MEPLVKELLERHKEDRDLTDPKVQQEVKRLREKYNRVNKELDDDEQLVGLNWSKANLKEWNLKEIKLSSSKYQADFSGTILKNSNFKGATLIKANFVNSEMQCINLNNAILINSKLNSTIIKEGNLIDALLMGAELKKANLEGADLEGANIREANLETVCLNKSNLSNANLWNANLSGGLLWKTNLNGANLVESKLIGARLEKADFRYSDIEKTDLRLSDLYMCKLQGSNIEYSKLSDKDINEMNEEQINKIIEEFIKEKIVTEIIYKAYPIHILHHRTFYDKKREYEKFRFEKATDIYRNIKNTLIQNGSYDLASEYHYKENRVNSKKLKASKKYGKWLLNSLFGLICGYGEKPLWIIPWIIFVILLFGTFFWSFNGVHQNQFDPIHPIDNYYFSVVTFATLGFGDLYPNSTQSFLNIPWFRVAAALEALFGAFLMALFVVVASKRIMR